MPEPKKDAEENEQAEEEEEGDAGIELEQDSDAASTASSHSHHSITSHDSNISHHFIEIINNTTHTSFSFPLPPSTYHLGDGSPPQSLNNPSTVDESPFAETYVPPPTRWRVRYRCAGWNKPCGAEVELSDQDSVRCRECGGSAFYKLRTEKMVQFEAR